MSSRSLMIPRVMLAAPASGSGKTTVMCALLSLFTEQGRHVEAFKCGPDYIDPMFHRAVLDTPSHNLDMFLCGGGDIGAQWVRHFLCRHGVTKGICVLEGAMGYYDGIGATWDNSAYAIAKATDTPVILVVNGKGSAISLAAQLHGFQTFQPDSHVVGFIVNNVKKSVYLYFKDAIEKATGLTACGYMPPLPEAALPSRHLGLVTADDIPDLQEKIALLKQTAGETLDLAAIEQIAAMAPALPEQAAEPPVHLQAFHQRDVVEVPSIIAVARDEAFCFYYDESLDILRDFGATIVYFSPLHDNHLPPCHGLYLGGGYPELHAAQLAANETMKQDIRDAIKNGMPCIAECGGFMYLLDGFDDGVKVWPWVGAMEGTSQMTKQLTRFGYVTMTAEGENSFIPKGTKIPAHEFHYSDSDHNGAAFLIQKPTGKRQWRGGYLSGNLLAGYPHFHFCSCPDVAARFLRACRKYRKSAGRP